MNEVDLDRGGHWRKIMLDDREKGHTMTMDTVHPGKKRKKGVKRDLELNY